MELIKTNVTDKKVLFRLMNSQQAKKVQDLEGQNFAINEWCVYLDGEAPADGEEDKRKRVFALDINGEVYGTISKTFIDSVLRIIEMFQGDDDWAVAVKGADTQKGRHFIYAEVI